MICILFISLIVLFDVYIIQNKLFFVNRKKNDMFDTFICREQVVLLRSLLSFGMIIVITIAKGLNWCDKMTFAERLVSLRREKSGMTQAQVGDALGISARVYGYYEAGDRLPKDAETYIRIADLFNCSLDWLFGRSLIKNFNTEGLDVVRVDRTVFLDALSRIQQGKDLLNEYLPVEEDINIDESEQK